MSHAVEYAPRAVSTRPAAALTAAAAVVIVALTAAAFWLSYAHLHTVAADHGLGGSAARAWAWPATLDLFIVAGELLMLRASLARTTDWWAVGLTVVGSGGSIALNVLGVEGTDPLAYVTAAVPPTAALLAFGALMRQVHTLLATEETELEPERDTAPPEAVPPVYLDREPEPAPVPEMSPTPELEPAPATASPLVICGGHLEIPTVPPRPRLDTEEAKAAILAAWAEGLSIREAARISTRSPAQVQRVYTRLESETGPQQNPGQIALEGIAA